MKRCLTLLALVTTLAAAAAIAQPSYTLDTDPIRLANRALEQGRLDDARARYEEAVAAGYHLAEAHGGLAEIALRQGRHHDAEAAYRAAIAAGGEHATRARAQFGVLLLRLERPDEARQQFEQALAADPGNWPAQYGLARLDLAAGDYEQTARRLEQGSKRRGLADGEDLYQHARALLLLATGDLAGAETAALRAMNLNPADPAYARLVARIYQQRGVPALAIQAYEQALATPGVQATAPLLHQLGNLYRAQQQYNEAHDRFVQAVAIDSSYVPVLGDLADLLRLADRDETAARIYLRYVAEAPDDTSAWLGLAESLMALKRFDQAADAAAHARELDPASEAARSTFSRAALQATDPALKARVAQELAADPDAGDLDAGSLLSLAAFLMEQKQYREAAVALDRAATVDSTLYQVPFQQGVLALRTADSAAAVSAFERAVALAPESAPVRLNLGIALYQAGRLPSAIPALRRATELDPDLTVARVMLAQALAASGELAEAEAHYRTVLERQPNHAGALRGVGFCRLRDGDYVDAASFYGRAADADPQSADAWAGLGSARLGQGRLDDAAAAFERARSLDPGNAMLQSGAKLLEQARNARKEN